MKHTLLQQSPYALKIQFRLAAEDLTDAPANPAPEWFTAQMQQAVGQFIREKAVHPCKEPVLKVLSKSPKGIDFTCDMQVFPPVTLPTSFKQTVEVPELEIPQDADLVQALEALQLKLAELSPVDRPAQWGDLLMIDLVGTCQNQLIPQSPQVYLQLVLKPSLSEDPFLKQLIGLTTGQEKKLTQTLPADYPYLPWRNAQANTYVYVHQVMEVRVPPATDALAEISGLAKSLDELLAVLYEQVRQQKHQAWLNQVKEAVIKPIVAASKVPFPASWEEAETQSQWEVTDARALREQAHIKISPTLLKLGWQSWKSHAYLQQQQAEALKTRLVLQEIALKEGLTLTHQQREDALNALAESLSWTPEQRQQTLSDGPSRLRLEGTFLLDKVARWLVSQAQLTCQGKILA